MASCVWDLKRNDTNEVTYKTERDHRFREFILVLPGGGDRQGVWKGHVHTARFKMRSHDPPQHRELCSCYMPACREETGENGFMDMYG